jgi:hypothetical protein
VACDFEHFEFLRRQLLSAEEALGRGVVHLRTVMILSANLGVIISVCAAIIENKNVVTKMLDPCEIAQHCTLLHVCTERHCGLLNVKRKLHRRASPLHRLPDSHSTGVRSPKTLPSVCDIEVKVSPRISPPEEEFGGAETIAPTPPHQVEGHRAELFEQKRIFRYD